MRIALFLLCLAPLYGQKIRELCAPCHAEQAKDARSHPHFRKGLDCDTCHGKSEAHRKATGAAAPDRVAAPDEMPALCGTCHTTPRKEYSASRHGKLVLARARPRAAHCATCHGYHAANSAAQMERQCLRCHDPLPRTCTRTGCAGCHRGHTLMDRR